MTTRQQEKGTQQGGNLDRILDDALRETDAENAHAVMPEERKPSMALEYLVTLKDDAVTAISAILGTAALVLAYAVGGNLPADIQHAIHEKWNRYNPEAASKLSMIITKPAVYGGLAYWYGSTHGWDSFDTVLAAAVVGIIAGMFEGSVRDAKGEENEPYAVGEPIVSTLFLPYRYYQSVRRRTEERIDESQKKSKVKARR